MNDETKQWRDALYNASVEAIDRGGALYLYLLRVRNL